MFEDIKIPQDLLPADGRFGCGPSLVRPEFLQGLAETGMSYMGTSHRKPAVKERVASVTRRMHDFLQVPEGYVVAMGNGGASLVWDMITFSLIEKKSAHFTNGEFSSKWYKSAAEAPFVEAEESKFDLGAGIEFAEKSDADVHCVTWNETSTGAMIPATPQCENSLLTVDATSAAGALKWDLTQTDLFYFSPQKAFGADGGLWVGIFSPKCIEQVNRVKESKRYIPAMLDFATALKNAESDQTYNTPALATLYLLDRQLEWLQAKGLDKVAAEQEAKHKLLEDWVNARPELSFYVEDPASRSRTVSTINIIDEIPYADLTKNLRSQGVLDIDCYRKLGKNQIRISLFPNVSLTDLEKLTKCINYLLDNR